MHYFFNDVINIKGFKQNKIKISEKPYKNILTYCISYETTNCVKPLYFIINNVNGAK